MGRIRQPTVAERFAPLYPCMQDLNNSRPLVPAVTKERRMVLFGWSWMILPAHAVGFETARLCAAAKIDTLAFMSIHNISHTRHLELLFDLYTRSLSSYKKCHFPILLFFLLKYVFIEPKI